MADGELLAWQRRCMQERGQVQCVRLLERPGKGRGGVGRLEVIGGKGRGAAAAAAAVLVGLWGCFVFAESDRIWQRSLARSLCFDFPKPPASHHPAPPSCSKKTQTQISGRDGEDTARHPLFT